MNIELSIPGEWRYRLGQLVFALPIYRFTLGGSWIGGSLTSRRGAADLLAAVPPDPWPGQADRGAAILKGEFEFYRQAAVGVRHTWRPVGMSERWLDELHSFEWLRDLRALGGDAARRKARELTADWILRQAKWQRVAWRPDVLGRRLYAWLGSYDFFCASATDEFKSRYIVGIVRQGRHLSRVLPGGVRGEPLLAAIKGLLAAGLAVRGREKWAAQALRLLERQIGLQILADGGHISRNPSVQLAVLQHLIDMRGALSTAGWEPPAYLIGAIDRAAPFARMLRHGDGGMALFNGSGEGQAWRVDMMLSQADARGRPPSSAPHSGFQRLVANRSAMLFDVGLPATKNSQASAHAGTLSFELSIGNDRVIVNCGALANAQDDWTRVQRSTAAHSTLIVEDTNSSAVTKNERRRGALPASHSRNESVGNLWLSATHDGYATRYGLRHRRRVYLASAGDDIRGEDALIILPDAKPRGGWMAHSYKVRFHLHPSVRAHKDADGNIVILRLPTGGTWRFKVDGGSVHIAEGIYLGSVDKAMQTTEQIVVSGVTGAADGNNIVANIRWSLQRIAVAQSVASPEGDRQLEEMAAETAAETAVGDAPAARPAARVTEDLFT